MACPKCGCVEVYVYDDEDDPTDDRLQCCAACGYVFDMDDHAPEPEEWEDLDPATAPASPAVPGRHQFDDDAVCVHCGFDGAEWWHWKRNTYEGKASEATQPLCTKN